MGKAKAKGIKVKSGSNKGKAGKGSHGSISKAGKMRHYNPVIWNPLERRKTKDGNMQRHKKKHKSPKLRHKRNYRVKVTIPRLIVIGIIARNPKLQKKRVRL